MSQHQDMFDWSDLLFLLPWRWQLVIGGAVILLIAIVLAWMHFHPAS
jgi:CHASE3 domain sensor protein